jgi:hypothetical protein
VRPAGKVTTCHLSANCQELAVRFKSHRLKIPFYNYLINRNCSGAGIQNKIKTEMVYLSNNLKLSSGWSID